MGMCGTTRRTQGRGSWAISSRTPACKQHAWRQSAVHPRAVPWTCGGRSRSRRCSCRLTPVPRVQVWGRASWHCTLPYVLRTGTPWQNGVEENLAGVCRQCCCTHVDRPSQGMLSTARVWACAQPQIGNRVQRTCPLDRRGGGPSRRSRAGRRTDHPRPSRSGRRWCSLKVMSSLLGHGQTVTPADKPAPCFKAAIAPPCEQHCDHSKTSMSAPQGSRAGAAAVHRLRLRPARRRRDRPPSPGMSSSPAVSQAQMMGQQVKVATPLPHCPRRGRCLGC